jgi:phosphoribosylcarboxyaminoimidazole (NCAIR) mutase
VITTVPKTAPPQESSPLSPADIAAHEAASYVRLPKRIPGATLKVDQIEDAYAERAHQLVAFEQAGYGLAAGGDES